MSGALWFLPFALQALAMGADEFGWHRRRPVSRLEWLGHMLDTAAFLACLAVPLLLPPAGRGLRFFAILAAASCLLVTKDEGVHRRRCTGGEHWVHAVLFLLHPMVLGAALALWLGLPGLGLPPAPWARAGLLGQALLVAGFLALQAVAGAGRRGLPGPEIDTAVYDTLGERWYSAQDDPVALLRAESRLRAGWLREDLAAAGGARPLDILDVGCGGGLLANDLAGAGHRVVGVDLSRPSLAVARRHDPTGGVGYAVMDARRLGFPDGRFDVVCMMDFLEHVEERDAVLAEAARVLRPGGRFYFHTFNRTPVSGLVAIKGVAWFVRNAPEHLHVYRLFLKPRELAELCVRHGLTPRELRGVAPRLRPGPLLKLLFTGRVDERFQFRFVRSTRVGYCGWAAKALSR